VQCPKSFGTHLGMNDTALGWRIQRMRGHAVRREDARIQSGWNGCHALSNSPSWLNGYLPAGTPRGGIELTGHCARRLLDAIAPQSSPDPGCDWSVGWRPLQRELPEVKVYVPGRKSAKRADLWLGTRDGVVSVEFKYAGRHGVRDVRGCVPTGWGRE
jgi:hypothetical protein